MEGLTDVERTCVLTCAVRCRVKERLTESGETTNSPLAKLDTRFDAAALATVLGPARNTAAARASLAFAGVHDTPLQEAWLTARALALDAVALASRCTQVVLLGCGLDMRPWRVADWPAGAVLFELDTAAILAVRARVAATIRSAVVERRSAAADLSDAASVAAALESAGFDRAKPTAWIAEGLLGYLSADGMLAMLQTIRDASCAGSVLVATAPPTPERHAEARGKMHHATFEHSSDTAARMRAAGWKTVSIEPSADVAQRFGLSASVDQDVLIARV